MSLISEPYAVPSRVQGVVRFFAQRGNRPIGRAEALALLAPGALLADGDPKMARATLDELERIGVLVKLAAEMLQLDPGIFGVAITLDTVPTILPGIILDRVLSGSDAGNQDLALMLAWFLEQDVLDPPGTLADSQELLAAQALSVQLPLNDLKFGNFKYWACYLGIGHMLASPKQVPVERLMPDPTTCLRRVFGEVLHASPEGYPVHEALRRVAKRCQLFEGGEIRARMREYLGRQADTDISSTTAHALLRLEEEGFVELADKADAPTIQVSAGGRARTVATIALCN